MAGPMPVRRIGLAPMVNCSVCPAADGTGDRACGTAPQRPAELGRDSYIGPVFSEPSRVLGQTVTEVVADPMHLKGAVRHEAYRRFLALIPSIIRRRASTLSTRRHFACGTTLLLQRGRPTFDRNSL